MSRITRTEKVTSPTRDQLRVMIVATFFAGMTAGVLLALGWDTAFPAYRPAMIDTDIMAREEAAVAGPAR